MDGVSHCFKGTLTVVSGDNLGSHYIGGFKSPSGALRKCRHCMATSEEMGSKCLPCWCSCIIVIKHVHVSPLQFNSDVFQPRTRESHARHCRALNGPLQGHLATTYGIVRHSILNTSEYFHVTDGLASDMMHDVLEGCVQYEMKELTKHFIDANVIKLANIKKSNTLLIPMLMSRTSPL